MIRTVAKPPVRSVQGLVGGADSLDVVRGKLPRDTAFIVQSLCRPRPGSKSVTDLIADEARRETRKVHCLVELAAAMC